MGSDRVDGDVVEIWRDELHTLRARWPNGAAIACRDFAQLRKVARLRGLDLSRWRWAR